MNQDNDDSDISSWRVVDENVADDPGVATGRNGGRR